MELSDFCITPGLECYTVRKQHNTPRKSLSKHILPAKNECYSTRGVIQKKIVESLVTERII